MLSKFNQLYNKIILEERRKDLKYTEKAKKGIPDEVSITVEGKDAERITKLTKELEQYKVQVEEITSKYKERSKVVQELGSEYFDSADKILTRVIETKSAVLKFGKVIDKEEIKTTYDTDKFESLLQDIISLMTTQGEQLGVMVKQLVDDSKYFKTETVKKAGIEKLYTTVNESVLDNIKSLITKSINKFKRWIGTFDNKQKDLFNMLDDFDEFII